MTLNGTNLEHASAYNRRLLLEAVRARGPISRAELARLTGLSAQTVSNIAAELRRLGLLQAQGRRRTGRGQPPVELAINPRGGYTIGLHFNRERLTAVFADLSGGVRRRRCWPARADGLLPLLTRAVRAMANGSDEGPVLGIGIAMPGPFDARLDDSHASALPERIAAATGLPVLLENDATAAALGERLYGAGRALRNFFLVYVGIGLGGGLILDGAPYKGAWGNAGELGHVVVAPGGRPCPCGNRGCLEAYFSLATARAELGTADIDARVASGEPAVLRWLDDAAARLAVALAGVENLLDPEAILIGGDASPAFLDALAARLGALPPTVSARRERAVPRILKATAGEDAGALGAAALPIFDMLRPSFRPILAPAAVRAGERRAMGAGR